MNVTTFDDYSLSSYSYGHSSSSSDTGYETEQTNNIYFKYIKDFFNSIVQFICPCEYSNSRNENETKKNV